MAANSVNRERGFTLVEVLVSLVIMAVAVMGIMGLYKSQTGASAFSRHTTEAAVLAEDKIEKLRTLGTAAAQAGSDATAVDPQGVAGGIFTRSWSEVLQTADYADITVTVTWTDDGVPHSMTMYGRRNR